MSSVPNCKFDDPSCTGYHGYSKGKSVTCPTAYANKLKSVREWRRGKSQDELLKRRAVNRNRVDRIKVDRGCVDCGYNAHPVALHFDHRPGVDKIKNVSQLLAYDWEVVQAEIDKCDVRCANCHAIVTASRGSSGWNK